MGLGEEAYLLVVTLVVAVSSILWHYRLGRRHLQERRRDQEMRDAEPLADRNDVVPPYELPITAATSVVGGRHQSTGVEVGSSKPRHRLAFLSHAGEDKPFVMFVLEAVEKANKAAFFDEDMAVGSCAGDEMETRAAEADEGVVVLSRPFLTKKWPMKELNIFLKNGVKIVPLYHKVTADELQEILATYDRKAGDDKHAFSLEMAREPVAWRTLMKEIAGTTRDVASTSLPDPRFWRNDVGRLSSMVGLRQEDFGKDAPSFVKAIAYMVTMPRLPDIVPPLPDHFVGPPLVDDVILALLSPETTRGVVVTGVGGAGKTLIASAVAQDTQVRRHFGHGVLWLNDKAGDFSEQRLLLQLKILAKQFQELVLIRHPRQGRTFQYDVVDFNDLRQAKEFFPMWQKRHSLQCLLVVDNAWNLQVLEAVGAMGFRILATARNKDAMPSSSGWRALPTLPIGEDDALLVLEKCSGALGRVPRESALQVARRCAFLPLALAIVGSMPLVVHAPLSADVWRKLHEKLKNTPQMQHSSGAGQESLNAVLSVSFNNLSHEQKGHFFKLAVLAKGIPAPEEMLRHLWDKEDLADARLVAKGLATRSLLEVRGDEYLVHDLLLDFAKGKIREFREVKPTASRQAQYLGRRDVLPTADQEESGRGIYSLIAQWRSLEELSEDRELEVHTYNSWLQELDKDCADTARIFQAVGTLFLKQGKYEEAGPLYERSLATSEKALGPDHPEVATVLNNRALLLEKQGKYEEAGPLYERSLVIREKALGPDHPEVAQSLNNWALLLESQGEYAEADPLYLRAIKIGEKTLGPDHPKLATRLNNRALLLEMQGKYAEAELLFERSQAIREKVLGPDHPDVATSLNNRAALLSAQGKYEEAEPLCKRSLAIDEKAYGPDHPEVATDLNNWADLLESQGKYAEADPLSLRAIEIGEKTLGPDHPKLATRLNNRALLLTAQGKYEQADPLSLRVIKIWEAALGPDHSQVATGLNNRAWLLKDQGKYDEAGSLYERSLAIYEKALGPDHPAVATTLNNQAVLLRAQDKYTEAIPLLERALSIRMKKLGGNHPATVISQNNLEFVRRKV